MKKVRDTKDTSFQEQEKVSQPITLYETHECENCSYAERLTARVIIFPERLYKYWRDLTKVNPNLELMGLFRFQEEGDKITITEITIPEQEIDAAQCKLLKRDGLWEGHIHSHHGMAAFFSGTDKTDTLPMYRFSVVSNHNGEFLAVEKLQLPCGGEYFKRLLVVIQEEEIFNPEELKSLVKSKVQIKEKERMLRAYHREMAQPSGSITHYPDDFTSL